MKLIPKSEGKGWGFGIAGMEDINERKAEAFLKFTN
jgi:hypothetical protein